MTKDKVLIQWLGKKSAGHEWFVVCYCEKCDKATNISVINDGTKPQIDDEVGICECGGKLILGYNKAWWADVEKREARGWKRHFSGVSSWERNDPKSHAYWRNNKTLEEAADILADEEEDPY